MVKDSLSPRTHRATSVTPHMWRPVLSAVVLLATLFCSALSFAQILGTAQLNTERRGHTATLLQNGKILIVGGDATGSAELYDPATQIFSLVSGNLGIARNLHSAVLLNNGQVLIVGGVNAQNAILNSAEIYDPASQSFHVPTNALQIPRALATLRLLPDGKVQVIGGDSDFSMEIFDPQDGKFNGVAYLPPSPALVVAPLLSRTRSAPAS